MSIAATVKPQSQVANDIDTSDWANTLVIRDAWDSAGNLLLKQPQSHAKRVRRELREICIPQTVGASDGAINLKSKRAYSM